MTVSNRLELISPDYWGGNDIEHPNEITAAPPPDQRCLNLRNYFRAAYLLGRGITAIVEEGSINEAQYEAGTVLTSDSLADGSLVTIEHEALQKHCYNNVRAAWKKSADEGDPGLHRPYVQYWLEQQDATDANRQSGWQSLIYPDKHLRYDRWVQWGVVLTARKAQVVQPFSFATTSLLARGGIKTQPYDRRNTAFIGAFLPLPITIGDITYSSSSPLIKNPAAADHIDRLSRVSSVDVVYVEPSGGHRSKSRWLARRLLPQLGVDPI